MMATDDAPLRPGRRRLLAGIGLAAASCPFAPALATGVAAGQHVTDAPVENRSEREDRVAWHGHHQAGVTTPRPANGMIVSFSVIADNPDELEDLFRRLTARIAFLTGGGAVPDLDPRLPPADSGIMGPVVQPDALTITVSLGRAFFDERAWLAGLAPAQLRRMVSFPNDALDPDICHGDLTLQICANAQDTTIHALRDIIKTLSDRLVLRWKQEGSVPAILPDANGTVQSARNLLGFRDGSANPDASDGDLMDQLVWVGQAHEEPDWARGGSYQAVRIIRNFVERWDRTPLREQEKIIGRMKMSGAPLDAPDTGEFRAPDLSSDAATPMDAHIRLANPRTAQTHRNLILRRPFNYSNGVTKSGHLDQGLLFICYQADLEQGFIAVQRRLDGEPLEEYIKPVGGGFFFALPGATTPSDFIGSTLIAAIRAQATLTLRP